VRIAFLSQQAAFLDAVGRQQSAIARTQEQIATGLKFSRAGQDPVGATQSLSLSDLINTNQRYITNAQYASNRLGLEEGALVGAGDILQRIRELVVQAANGPQSAENRAMIAAEVRARLDELVASANTRDGNGEYLFAGTATATQPFVRSAGAAAYQGDQLQRLVQISADQYVADSDSGAAVFELIRNGNGVYSVAQAPGNSGTGLVGARTVVDPGQYDGGAYRLTFTAPDAWEVRDASNALVASGAYLPGDAITFRGLSIAISGTPAAGDAYSVDPSVNQSVFATIERLLATLARPDGTPADQTALANDLGNTLGDLDQALGNLLEVRAGIGARLSALDSRTDQLNGANVELRNALSGLRDTDYAEALTRLEQQLTTLEAAQKAYISATGLSLFDYL
jgi:flagellar hook-associated protein 3 FlgL